MNDHDPYEAFLAAPRTPGPDSEAADPETAFIAGEAALDTGGPDERGPGPQAAVLRAFGLTGPDIEPGA